MSGCTRPIATLAVLAVIVVGAVIVGRQVAERRDDGVTASPTPTGSPNETERQSASPTASATTGPASGLVRHENRILGYSVDLPTGYRRYISNIVTGSAEALGTDAYTLRTEQADREECLRDGGDGPPPRDRETDIGIAASRNVRGISAADWASTPFEPGGQSLSTHRKVEPAMIAGREAVRVTWEQTGETALYVIRADDRMYVLSPGLWSLPSELPKGWLDDIAATFRAIQPQAFPSATPSRPPRDAARELGQRLARAFAARDVDAVAALMPDCKINVTAVIASLPQGGGALHRSVALFAAALRDRFARGDLTVTVDPEVQIGREELFVRSTWSEPDRTTRIDLYLAERNGRWQWFIAEHHYPSLVGNSCIPYRSPWVTGTGAC